MSQNNPMKRAGFAQGIMEISSTKKEEIGTLRITQDGRKFRYARAGSTALSAGKMSVAARPNAQQINVALSSAASKGDKEVVVAITYAAAIDENGLAGGYLQINDGTHEGHQYPIQSNTALGSSDTTITVHLAEPLKSDISTSATEVSLIPSPWYDTEESATEENIPVGIPPLAVTADYYYWAQTGGLAICLVHGTPAIGTMLIVSSSPSGGLRAMAASVDIDIPIVAKMAATAGVSGEYKPIQLLID